MAVLSYSTDVTSLSSDQVRGFHQEWAYDFSPDRILSSLCGSEWAMVALDDKRVVGYIAVIGDGQIFAFVTSIEVLPDYRNQGIGTRLLQAALEHFRGRYALDLVCDENVAPFYAALGFRQFVGMGRRNYSA